jgi:flagellar basal body rod protein FlgG
VANVNTGEFKASRAVLEEVPNQGGARVQEVRQTSASGGMVPVDKPVQSGNAAPVQARVMVQASNTEIAQEMVNMTQNENVFAANAAVIRTQDSMIGGLIDEMA